MALKGGHLGNVHDCLISQTFLLELWSKIIIENLKIKIAILSLTFIMWQTDILGGSPFDLHIFMDTL